MRDSLFVDNIIMKLGVYSLKNVLFQGEAKSVNLKTRAGEITVLDRHKPLISIIAAGMIRIEDASGKVSEIPARGGFLEVRDNNESRLLINELQ